MKYFVPIFLLNFIVGALEFFIPIKFAAAGINLTLIAILLSVGSFISMILDIPAGKLSDVVGREKMLGIGMFLVAILASILYFLNSIVFFWLAIILFGVAYGLNWSAMLALVGDSSSDKNQGRMFGKFFSLSAIGEGLSPIILILVMAKFGSNFPFLAGMILSVVSAIIFWNSKDSKQKIVNKKVTFSYSSSFKLFKKSFRINLFLAAIGFLVAFFWESVWFSQPLIGFYENSMIDSALIVAFFTLPGILFSEFLGELIDTFKERKVFFSSAMVIFFSFLGFYFSQNLVLKIVFIFVAAVGIQGIWLVMDVLATKLHKPEERGEFFGILETVRDASYLIAPLFIAGTYRMIGLEGIFIVNSVMAGLIFLLGVRVLKV